MNTPTPTPKQPNPPAPERPAAYQPPALTVLGTLAHLTHGQNLGNNSDLTFVGSGVH